MGVARLLAHALKTVITAVPVFPSLVAEIIAVPAATPVTSPVLLTDATAVLEEVQLTVRPERTLPPASSVAAVSCCVELTPTDAVAGVTVTEPTGGGAT